MIISYYSPGSVPTNLSRGRFGPTTISPGEDIDIKELNPKVNTHTHTHTHTVVIFRHGGSL